MPKIVTLGGGGGHSQVLKALKDMPDVEITAICPSTDSGGSTGILRREYAGKGYTGDLTKCVTALCVDKGLADALSFRYEKGSLDGHSVKNILFHGLEKTQGAEEALKTIGTMCGLGKHRVLPVTTQETELCAHLKVGKTVIGETNIDTLARNPLWNPDSHAIADICLKPAASAAKNVLQAIRSADHIIVCPGDLYSSILPVLLPKGMRKDLRESKAPVTIILNIMNKKGETDGYAAEDFIRKIENHLGRKATSILCNDAPIPKQALLTYSLENKTALRVRTRLKDKRIIFAPLAKIDEKGQLLSDPTEIREALSFISHT
ncbi:MAG: gluconeogenesis factor YvcK family protein [Candidatus Paceibacterota bacterium]|jgi:uncharacterized cofD-like protein